MSKIYLEYSDLLEQNNNLQKIVNGFDQCKEEYEDALRLTDDLKSQLHEAKEYIFTLKKKIKTKSQAKQLI